jgi:hypothetical protein
MVLLDFLLFGSSRIGVIGQPQVRRCNYNSLSMREAAGSQQIVSKLLRPVAAAPNIGDCAPGGLPNRAFNLRQVNIPQVKLWPCVFATLGVARA